MQKFIHTLMERLRRFIRGSNHDTTEQVTDCAADPIGGETNLDADPVRFTTALLTHLGIRFNGMRYHDRSISEMLLDDISRFDGKSGARAKVTIKWDPSDASSISVWNRAARPRPAWITVPTVGIVTGERLSFADYAAVREFAKTLAFNTDEERSEARERLRQHWERLADLPPIRDIRQVGGDVDPWDDPFDDERVTTADDIIGITVDPLVSELPQGRHGSKAALVKANRTKKHKKAGTAAAATRLPSRKSRKPSSGALAKAERAKGRKKTGATAASARRLPTRKSK